MSLGNIREANISGHDASMKLEWPINRRCEVSAYMYPIGGDI